MSDAAHESRTLRSSAIAEKNQRGSFVFCCCPDVFLSSLIIIQNNAYMTVTILADRSARQYDRLLALSWRSTVCL